MGTQKSYFAGMTGSVTVDGGIHIGRQTNYEESLPSSSWWCRSGSYLIKVGVYTMGTGKLQTRAPPKRATECNLHNTLDQLDESFVGSLGPWGSHIHGTPCVYLLLLFLLEFLILIGTLQLSLIIHPEWFSICRLSGKPSLKTFLWENSSKLQATDKK